MVKVISQISKTDLCIIITQEAAEKNNDLLLKMVLFSYQTVLQRLIVQEKGVSRVRNFLSSFLTKPFQHSAVPDACGW